MLNEIRVGMDFVYNKGILPESKYSMLTLLLKQINERFEMLRKLGYKPVVELPKAECKTNGNAAKPSGSDYSHPSQSAHQSTSPTVASPSPSENKDPSAAVATDSKKSSMKKTGSALQYK